MDLRTGGLHELALQQALEVARDTEMPAPLSALARQLCASTRPALGTPHTLDTHRDLLNARGLTVLLAGSKRPSGS